MKIASRATLTGLFLLTFALAAAHRGAGRDEAALAMGNAASAFLDGLDANQRSRAVFALESPLRTNWHFVPRERAGLALGDLDGASRARFDALLGTGLSPQGRAKFDGVLKLESLLREIESKPDRPATWRDPARYHIAIFGVPGTDPWGWRLEGHHWSVHFTSVDADVIAVTPNFVGANPARTSEGPDSHFELLGAEDQRASDFVSSLSDEQREAARLAGKMPTDVLLDPTRANLDTPPAGIGAALLDAKQKELLVAIVHGYFADLSAPLAQRERQRFDVTAQDQLHFAWSGESAGQGPWYWRVTGPYFAIEFVYPEGNVGHAHRIWRDFERDFGGDALREHLKSER